MINNDLLLHNLKTRAEFSKCDGCDNYLNYICTDGNDWEVCDEKIETNTWED